MPAPIVVVRINRVADAAFHVDTYDDGIDDLPAAGTREFCQRQHRRARALRPRCLERMRDGVVDGGVVGALLVGEARHAVAGDEGEARIGAADVADQRRRRNPRKLIAR